MSWHLDFIAASRQAAKERLGAEAASSRFPDTVRDQIAATIDAVRVPPGCVLAIECEGSWDNGCVGTHINVRTVSFIGPKGVCGAIDEANAKQSS